jgi:beta-lactamase regulating signal transducer with metallopeptidase domain
MIAEALALLVRINIALACVVILVLALRTTMRSWFGARAAYALWWIVPTSLVALMLPARTIESVDSVAGAVAAHAAVVPGGLTTQMSTVMLFDASSLLFGLWLAGVVAMLMILTVRQRSFVAALGPLSRDGDGVLRAATSCESPVLVGAISPRLVLPKDFETRFEPIERELVLTHERVHSQRRDPLVNGLAALVLCVLWFNPLVHWAVRAMRIDQELACDAVVADRYPRARRVYAEAMLKAQIGLMSLPVGCAWSARGTHPLRLRIEMLTRDPPGARRVAAGSLLAALICSLAGCAVWTSQPPQSVSVDERGITSPLRASDAELLRAARKGNFRRAKSAIAAGADVNVRSKRGMTALVIAARAEDMRILNLLLDHGADVNLTSRGEGNALVAAARRGHVRAVTALVEHGAAVNAIVPGYGTPLAASVRTGHYYVVKYLVEHGADVNLASPPPAPWDRWGVVRTPLEVAVNGHHTSTAAYLRSMGAEMSIVTD